MIYVNITGGLGNQMFQYAFARKLQKEYKQDIVLNTWELETYDKQRVYCLNKFRLNKNVYLDNKRMPWFAHRRSLLGKILRKISKRLMFKYGLYRNSYVWYGERKIDLPKLSEVKDIYVAGYWQSADYSIDVLKDIKDDFQLLYDVSFEQKKLIEEIDFNDSVCIHIRRGDYLGTGYEVCNQKYYLQAMKMLEQKHTSLVYYVFSDDIEWARTNIKSKCEIRFVEGNASYIDMILMSHCKHFIISNSTFSWWAQYLSDADDRDVYAPELWHRELDNFNLYMEDWHIIHLD